MEDAKIVEDALVCTILACSATLSCQEEEEKQRKRRKIRRRELLLDRNKYGTHVVTVNGLRENDLHFFRRYLRKIYSLF